MTGRISKERTAKGFQQGIPLLFRFYQDCEATREGDRFFQKKRGVYPSLGAIYSLEPGADVSSEVSLTLSVSDRVGPVIWAPTPSPASVMLALVEGASKCGVTEVESREPVW